jgi:hypothetical protein
MYILCKFWHFSLFQPTCRTEPDELIFFWAASYFLFCWPVLCPILTLFSAYPSDLFGGLKSDFASFYSRNEPMFPGKLVLFNFILYYLEYEELVEVVE